MLERSAPCVKIRRFLTKKSKRSLIEIALPLHFICCDG
jgi:hypothetical protein